MKYIVIPTPGEVEIREMEKPSPGRGEVLLKLLRGGVCGSDMGTYKGTFLYASYPRIPFHEFSGEIVELGEGVDTLKTGMVVTSNPYYQCGTCYSCKRGHFNCCQSLRVLGAQWDGAARQYFVVPAERVFDGKGLDAQTLALIEPFCISMHAVRRAAVKPGERVLIVGAGPIGMFALLAAKSRGANVTICDLSASRLERAKALGADRIVDTSKENLDEKVKEITGNDGFDVCLECVGLPSTFQNCIDAAAFRGRVILVGIGKQTMDFKFAALQTKELDVLGSRNALDEDFIELIDDVKAGKYDLSTMVTDIYDFADAPRAFQDIAQNGENMLKTMIRF